MLITLIMPWLLSIASASVTAALPVLLVWFSGHLKLSKNVLLNQLISGAVARGAGITLADMQPGTVVASGASLSKGVDYVAASFPDAVAALGVAPAHIGVMVQAELAKLLLHKVAG
jgi:hypothetical protein